MKTHQTEENKKDSFFLERDAEGLARERVERAKNSIAKSLNALETTAQELKWACESQGWNEDIVFQLEDAATKLGYALATLTRWYEDESTPV